MKLTQISLFALACAAAPAAANAGSLETGVNLGGPEVMVRSVPPQERIETIPVSPGPGYF